MHFFLHPLGHSTAHSSFNHQSEPFEVGGDTKAAQQKYDIQLYLWYYVRLEETAVKWQTHKLTHAHRHTPHDLFGWFVTISHVIWMSHSEMNERKLYFPSMSRLTSYHWTTQIVKLWIKPAFKLGNYKAALLACMSCNDVWREKAGCQLYRAQPPFLSAL